MTKKQIIAEIKRTTTENDGKTLGLKAFLKTTGISRSSIIGKYWRNWGEALVDAGFKPNKASEAFKKDTILLNIILLARKVGHFPTAPDMRIEKRHNPFFPGYAVINRLGKYNERVELIRKYIDEHKEYYDVLEFLPEPMSIDHYNASDSKNVEETDGFVYIVQEQFSKHYKIGKTFDVPRRHREIKLELPGDMIKIHSIRTDDPSGIEAYWHKRFEEKRVKGEWFELSQKDIRAFKKRKKFM